MTQTRLAGHGDQSMSAIRGKAGVPMLFAQKRTSLRSRDMSATCQ